MTLRLACALLLATLAACQVAPPRATGPGDADTSVALQLARQGRPAEAAAIYERAADHAAGVDAAVWRLLAAESWWAAEEYERAALQLDRADGARLPHEYAVRAQILAARLAMHEGRAGEALVRLSGDLRLLPAPLAAAALGVRADANLALGRNHEAVTDLVARERFLEGHDAIAANQERIWLAVRRLDTGRDGVDDPVLAGWLALVELRHRAWQDPAGFDDALRAWQQKHAGHTAAGIFVPRLIEEQQRLAAGVREIALLLPLTGRFEAAAAAVRDGFMAAHFRHPDPVRRPRVRVYDTGGDPANAPASYRQAVANGADFVIGPLQRESVAALASSGELTVPVLALNTLDAFDRLIAPASMYQFGLVPEVEAEQVADRAVLEGHTRAIALIPDNDLGLRLLGAFTERFAEYGGEVIAAQLYDPQQRDHSVPITRALAIDESRSRAQTLRIVLNAPLQAEPRRRRDAEFVFLVATPQQGRSLRPQLRFHHASDLPVYATSMLYAGTPDRAMDADLNGIAFTDMPWTIAPDPATQRVQDELGAVLGPAMARNTRLFALGYDAYRLAPVLRHDPTLLHEPIPAATGALRLHEDGRIHRTLTWAQFRGGLPRILQTPVTPPADLTEPEPTAGR
ncbi:MAG: penicillin-binding protein activator [Xanthomonadaceae bacterium]|nr:penicillin-binding protein activator [Xanthomonadaceae bacterium]